MIVENVRMRDFYKYIDKFSHQEINEYNTINKNKYNLVLLENMY